MSWVLNNVELQLGIAIMPLGYSRMILQMENSFSTGLVEFIQLCQKNYNIISLSIKGGHTTHIYKYMAKYLISPLYFTILVYCTPQLSVFPITCINFYFVSISHMNLIFFCAYITHEFNIKAC